MPDSVAYQPDLMDRIFTQKRMHSYQRVFGRLTDREMVGIYIWNQTLGGELYPLLSAAEITLRNAIDSAFITFAGQRWWKRVQYKSYASVAGHIPPFEVKAMKDNFSKAAVYVRKEKHQRYHRRNHTPSHEEIVASTEFSTWEFAMNDELLGPGLFWNTMITQVFKGQWPSQSGANTLSTARDQVKTIREYRNRVAHNEPLWKAYQVNTPQDAIAYINTKIDTVEQLIQLLSPEKHDLLTKHRLFSNARRINSLSEITRFRTTGNAQWLGSFGDVTSAFQHAKDTNSPVLCKLSPGAEPFLIIPQ
ncbi:MULTISPECIES: Abi family protein [unclassified Brenneria]|uniref:Abi family protein n=1 Tax=unclassified Brenneria TaxID=2634434 RepID=UPI0029C4D9F3|nr:MULTISPECIES: Abi family protein [unclassified Brenneria]MDX5628405.1 Abi family protein [Brenneria sp. L3-3Z]MDX5695412.1 Abi family protein [Brenneria sp. L4-2C]